MSAQALLERLEGVKGRDGKWGARCPVHGDKHASLSVKELSDGRVLIHCHAACATADILASVGLTFPDLMPERLSDERMRPLRLPWVAVELHEMRRQLTWALIVLGDIEHMRPSSPVDRAKAGEAANRLAKWLRAVTP